MNPAVPCDLAIDVVPLGSRLSEANIDGSMITDVAVLLLDDEPVAVTGVRIDCANGVTIYSVPNDDAFNRVVTSIENEPLATPVTLCPIGQFRGS